MVKLYWHVNPVSMIPFWETGTYPNCHPPYVFAKPFHFRIQLYILCKRNPALPFGEGFGSAVLWLNKNLQPQVSATLENRDVSLTASEMPNQLNSNGRPKLFDVDIFIEKHSTRVISVGWYQLQYLSH